MRFAFLLMVCSLAAPCCADLSVQTTATEGALSPLTTIAIDGMTPLDEWISTLPEPGFAQEPLPEPVASASVVLVTSNEPDSASLFLVALGSMGVWQLSRSSRKLHLGVTPEWYHAGGPSQVGHATPLDLSFTDAVLAICVFELPSTDAAGAREVCVPPPLLRPQLAALSAVTARAPPAC